MARRAPLFQSLDSFRLEGLKEVVTVKAPGNGSDWTQVVPGGEQWRVLLARSILTASAVVANRVVRWTVQSADGIIGEVESSAAQVASATVRYTFIGGAYAAQAGQSAGRPSLGVPLLWLPSGFVFGVATSGLDAGDSWSNIVLWVERLYVADGAMWQDEHTHFNARKVPVTH